MNRLPIMTAGEATSWPVSGLLAGRPEGRGRAFAGAQHRSQRRHGASKGLRSAAAPFGPASGGVSR